MTAGGALRGVLFATVAAAVVIFFMGVYIIMQQRIGARVRAQLDELATSQARLYPSPTFETDSAESATERESPSPSVPIRAEFLRITDDVSVYHKESHEEIKLTAGMTVRLIVRYRHDVTIGYKGAYYSIPTAFTQPTK
jgi:hypothetical protein